MTRTQRNQQLDRFHTIADECRATEGGDITLNESDQSAIIAADDLITKLRQGGGKGGEAVTPAKSAASANNGKLGGRPKGKKTD